MAKQMLDTLVQAGENEFTEFRGTYNTDDVLRAIIGLANGPSTGYLVLGIELTKEDSKVVPQISGVQGAEAVVQQLRRLCEEQCVPPLIPTAELIELIGHPPATVIVLEIRGKVDEQPYHPRDREITWIRIGGETRIVRLTEEAPALIAERRRAWQYELEYRASSAILRRVRFRRFRSLFHAELDLKPLNIIIGPNASGKSNLFKGLAFLRDIVVEKEWKRHEASGRHLFWYGAQPDQLSIEISAELPEQRGSFPPAYGLALRLESERLAIVGETLTLKRNAGDPAPVNYIVRAGRQAHFYREAVSSEQILRAMPPQTTVLQELGNETDFAPVAGLYRFIEGWRLLAVNSQAARGSTRHSESLVPLAEDGSNLSAVLYALSRQDPPDLFEEIQDRLGRAIGFPGALEALVSPSLTGGPSKVSIAFREHAFPYLPEPIPAESMSDGTIRLLAILTALIGDPTATLICVEEPDHGLHPHLMLRLADAIRSVVSAEPDPDAISVHRPQVILTTHNPELLNCFNLIEEKDYLQVFIAARDPSDGRTIFKPVDADALAHWLLDYRLGDLVNMGVIR